MSTSHFLHWNWNEKKIPASNTIPAIHLADALVRGPTFFDRVTVGTIRSDTVTFLRLRTLLFFDKTNLEKVSTLTKWCQNCQFQIVIDNGKVSMGKMLPSSKQANLSRTPLKSEAPIRGWVHLKIENFIRIPIFGKIFDFELGVSPYRHLWNFIIQWLRIGNFSIILQPSIALVRFVYFCGHFSVKLHELSQRHTISVYQEI